MSTDFQNPRASARGAVKPAEIVARLRAVAADMESLGAAMDYFGGFNGRMAQHGREMVGAAGIAREWADEIEAEAPPQ